MISVLGIRAAFASVATAPPAEKARLLAEGISTAMNFAAIGLVVALIGTAVLIGSVIGLLVARPKDADGQVSGRRASPGLPDGQG